MIRSEYGQHQAVAEKLHNFNTPSATLLRIDKQLEEKQVSCSEKSFCCLRLLSPCLLPFAIVPFLTPLAAISGPQTALFSVWTCIGIGCCLCCWECKNRENLNARLEECKTLEDLKKHLQDDPPEPKINTNDLPETENFAYLWANKEYAAALRSSTKLPKNVGFCSADRRIHRKFLNGALKEHLHPFHRNWFANNEEEREWIPKLCRDKSDSWFSRLALWYKALSEAEDMLDQSDEGFAVVPAAPLLDHTLFLEKGLSPPSLDGLELWT